MSSEENAARCVLRRYDELYGIYRQLHPATVEVQHRLAAIQHG